ncbi:torsin-1A-like [Phyllobates terribilis]|uniref:torsin-1A-like n=1 Tax=Phyllobates terribilis TaxID=111132 RepID=UPI003CCB40F8
MAAVRGSGPRTWLLFLLLAFPPLHVAVSLEPITMSAAASAITGYLYSEIYCGWLSECCQVDKPFNSTGLDVDLREKLFGQHLAHKIIYKSVTRFMSDKDPRKPLVLSLHGWSGTGKSFVSKIIVENIYELGMRSKFVHLFSSELHFPHEGLIPRYKDQLQSWIRGNTSECPHSIFIFDEMDKLHPGLIDSIKPFLDYYEHIDGVSYRKAIFIFISNAGGNLINRLMLQFWNLGKRREDLELKEVEDKLSSELFNNNNSGFWHSGLIEKNLIDYFVPFLPLEFHHVKQCVLEELRLRGLQKDENLASRVAKNMSYFPEETKLFSTKGCKTVQSQLYLTPWLQQHEDTCGVTNSADIDCA